MATSRTQSNSKKKSVKTAVKKTIVKKQEESAPQPSEEKLSIINQYAVKPGDTGSPEVQVALLTARIEKLTKHLQANPSDNHSRRGLLGIVSKRRRLLNYLESKEKARYEDVIKKIGLSK